MRLDDYGEQFVEVVALAVLPFTLRSTAGDDFSVKGFHRAQEACFDLAPRTHRRIGRAHIRQVEAKGSARLAVLK